MLSNSYIASFILLSSLVLTVVQAGDDDWESPVYNYFYQFQLPIPPVAKALATYINPSTGIPIDYYEVHIKPVQKQLYPNLPATNLVGYDGLVPGPMFKIIKGRESVVRFVNEYTGGRPSSIHLHGSPSRTPFDGWAEDTIEPGQYKDYYYPNYQSARTLWYHDHAIHVTSLNAYQGQAGLYILYDPVEEARLALPSGSYDIPLMLASVQIERNGQLKSIVDERTSMYGDVFLVNGQPWPHLVVEPRKYRFRLLDSSVSRTFLLSLVQQGSNSTIPFHVIAADAGYLTSPQQTNKLYIAMAERYEIVVDFSKYAGKNITMKNSRDVMQDEDYGGTDRVMQFRVRPQVLDNTNNGPLPSQLANITWPAPRTTVDRHFKFERTDSEWRINGVGFADIANRILADPPRGQTEVWELENSSGGWSHPIHIHLIDFKVIYRQGDRNVFNYESNGLKDVVLLGRNEKVRVLAHYQPWDGVYMFHCHNLIHEDHDMMAAFNVTALPGLGYNETTRFIDPMEQRFRAKTWTRTNLTSVVSETLPFFASLNAYSQVNGVVDALEKYWST